MRVDPGVEVSVDESVSVDAMEVADGLRFSGPLLSRSSRCELLLEERFGSCTGLRSPAKVAVDTELATG